MIFELPGLLVSWDFLLNKYNQNRPKNVKQEAGDAPSGIKIDAVLGRIAVGAPSIDSLLPSGRPAIANSEPNHMLLSMSDVEHVIRPCPNLLVFDFCSARLVSLAYISTNLCSTAWFKENSSSKIRRSSSYNPLGEESLGKSGQRRTVAESRGFISLITAAPLQRAATLSLPRACGGVEVHPAKECNLLHWNSSVGSLMSCATRSDNDMERNSWIFLANVDPKWFKRFKKIMLTIFHVIPNNEFSMVQRLPDAAPEQIFRQARSNKKTDPKKFGGQERHEISFV